LKKAGYLTNSSINMKNIKQSKENRETGEIYGCGKLRFESEAQVALFPPRRDVRVA